MEGTSFSMDDEETTGVVSAPLGDIGREWVADCLSRGGPLAQAFQAGVHLSRGEVVALVPPETPREKLGEPEWGGVLTRDSDPGRELDLLEAEFIAEGAAYVIADDDLSRVGDPVLADSEDVAPVEGGCVVFWTRLPTADGLRNHLCLGYPSVAFVVSARGGQSHLDVIDDLARGETDLVIALIVGAYDAETWIVWRRNT
jgi:hypothetical protein